MTTPPSAESPDTGLDRRLDDGMNALTEALEDILDVDAGLRDTQLFARQRPLEDGLDTVMDVDAGLGAIVPQIQPDPLRADSDVPAGTLMAFAARFANHSLQERLELRSQIPVGNLRDVRTIAEVLDLALLLGQGLAVDSGASRESALARAIAIAREIPRTRARARNAANELVRAIGLGRASDRYLLNVLVSALARDLDNALALALDVTRKRDLTRDIHVLAREFAQTITGYQGRVNDLTSVRDLIDAIAVLDAAATDFTAADLTQVDLGRIDLQGVRWSSSTTTWPAEWHALIQEASVQVDPDRQPDLYEIRDDPHVPNTAIDTSHR